MNENASPWKRLGDLVIARRTQLGMRTTKALADRMDMSSRLLGDLENGRKSSYSPSTLLVLEETLEWAPGSIRSIIEGGSPAPRPAEPSSQQLLVEELGETLAEADFRLKEMRGRGFSEDEQSEFMAVVVDALAGELTDRIAKVREPANLVRLRHFVDDLLMSEAKVQLRVAPEDRAEASPTAAPSQGPLAPPPGSRRRVGAAEEVLRGERSELPEPASPEFRSGLPS